jgi:anti-sigma factor RsiW
MDCPARQNLEAFFDGEVTGDERKALEGHVASCHTCAAALDELRAVWAALDAYPEPEIPGIDPRTIIARAEVRQRRITYLKVGSAVAAVALFVISLWGVGVMDTDDGIPPAVKQDIVANWEIIHNLDMLQDLEDGDLEILENLEILEELPLELVNGSENG